MRLNAKLSLLFFLLTVIPVCLVGYLSFMNSRKTIEENMVTHLMSTNLLKKAEVERWVRDQALTLEMLSKSPFFKGNFPSMFEVHDETDAGHLAAHHRIEAHLSPAVEEGGGFLELFILRAVDGLVLISTTHNQQGKYLDDKTYFIKGQVGTFIQNLYYSMSIQQAAMTISTPLKDPHDNTIAVLAGRLNLSQLSAIMEKRSELSHSEDTYLVNKFKIFVTEPRFGTGYASKKSVHTEGIAAAMAKKDGVGFYPGYRGVPVIGAHQWMPTWELCLITEVDQSEAYAPVRSLRQGVLSIAAVIALLAAGFGWLSAYKITIPLRRLVDAAEAIGTDRLEVVLDTDGSGEVADLAKAFDRMVKRLSSTLVFRDALLAEIAERKKAEQMREMGPGRFEALQRRTPAICLRGVPRPAGTPAHGLQLHSAAGRPL